MFKRIGCVVGALAGIILAFMVASWMVDAVFGGGGKGEVEEAAETVPENSLGLISLSNPQELIEEVIDALEDEADESKEFGRLWEQAAEESRKMFGFDATDPGHWEDLGFDLAVPVTAAFPKVDRRGEPVGVVVSIGVDDETDAVDFFKKTVKTLGMKSKETVKDGVSIFEVSERDRVQFRAALKDDHMFFMYGDRSDLESLDLLDYVNDAEERPMSDNDVFNDSLDGLDYGGMASFFMNLRKLRRQVERVPAFLDLVDGFAAAAGESEMCAFLLANEKSDDAAEILDMIDSGSKCRSFLERLNEPLAALTYSMEDPIGVFIKIVDQEEGLKKEIYRDAKRDLGITIDELREQLMDGAGGIAFYPGKGMLPAFVGFLQVNDEEKAAKIVGKMCKEDSYKNVSGVEKPNVLYVKESRWSHMTCGVIDEYVVFGEGKAAAGMLKTLAKGDDCDGWDAEVGGSDLFAGQVSIHGYAKMLAPMMGFREIDAKEMLDGIDSDSKAFFSVDVTGNGLRCRVETEGDVGAVRDSVSLAVMMALKELR